VYFLACCRPGATEELSNGVASFKKYGTTSPAGKDDEKVTVAFVDGAQSTEKSKSKKKASLIMALTKTFLGYFSFGSLLIFVYCFLAFINPYLLKYVLHLIACFSHSTVISVRVVNRYCGLWYFFLTLAKITLEYCYEFLHQCDYDF
jgi:hypothetical protein